MTGEIPEDEYETIVAMLTEAGLVESYVTEDGAEALRLTERGEQVGRALAMAGDDDANAVFDALLEGQG